jgi:aerobic carbon-monoxide dehydrogenase small subunit
LTIRFSLNERPIEIECEPNRRLIDILRQDLGELSVHRGCSDGMCGGCWVLFQENGFGRPAPSCMLPAYRMEGTHVFTASAILASEPGEDIACAFAEVGLLPSRARAAAPVVLVEWVLQSRRRVTAHDESRREAVNEGFDRNRESSAVWADSERRFFDARIEIPPIVREAVERAWKYRQRRET